MTEYDAICYGLPVEVLTISKAAEQGEKRGLAPRISLWSSNASLDTCAAIIVTRVPRRFSTTPSAHLTKEMVEGNCVFSSCDHPATQDVYKPVLLCLASHTQATPRLRQELRGTAKGYSDKLAEGARQKKADETKIAELNVEVERLAQRCKDLVEGGEISDEASEHFVRVVDLHVQETGVCGTECMLAVGGLVEHILPFLAIRTPTSRCNY